ncbi:MAG TPA: NAD(P)-binding domain-containing protein [Gaiellaceae bacterium]|nr:NAD(P)-binding domain-containing protein [Gaiellaceae bacterium]
MSAPAEQFQTVIIGGGQAGLAAGYYLKRQGERFVILDAGERVGDSWRKRWPSLRLYSPAHLDGLPGMPFPAPRHSFPTTNEFADFLERYAKRFDLPVRTGVQVNRLSKNGDGYVITAGEERFEANNVVVATGGMQVPVVPAFAADLDPHITQLHSFDYRSPDQLQEGPVLVVGAAHSGSDIAFELSSQRETILVGRDTGQIPLPLESRRMRLAWPVMKFMATRVLTIDTPLGRKMRPKIRAHGGPALRYKTADLLAAGVERVFVRMAGVRHGLPMLEDGRVLDVSNVIWCTGFRPDFSWIDLPLEYEDGGYPRQYRGAVASLPGLYFVGMIFLHSFSSTLVIGAGRDGRRVAEQIAARSKKLAKQMAVTRIPEMAEQQALS